MDFRQLTYIKTVAEHQSITSAAKSLFITQPSLSHFISKTEEEMGAQIFDRSTYPIRLTYAGEKYLSAAEKILMLSEELKKEFRDISHNKKGRIKLGIPVERSSYMLPLILPEYHKRFPGIDIQVHESGSEVLYDQVLKGKMDFIITMFQSFEDSLEYEVIYKEELFLVAGEDVITQEHLLKNRKDTVDLDKLSDLPFILLKKGRGIRTAVDDVFKKHNFTPSILLETTSNSTAYRLASASMGVAIVPDMTLKLVHSINMPKIYSVTENTLTWDIIIAYRKDAYISHVEKEFINMAKEIFSGK